MPISDIAVLLVDTGGRQSTVGRAFGNTLTFPCAIVREEPIALIFFSKEQFKLTLHCRNQVDPYALPQNFGHEVGHIFGCNHYVDNSPYYPYSRGYRLPGTRWRTILA